MSQHRLLSSVIRITLGANTHICSQAAYRTRTVPVKLKPQGFSGRTVPVCLRTLCSLVKSDGQVTGLITSRETDAVASQEGTEPEVTLSAPAKQQPVQDKMLTIYSKEGMVTMKRTDSYEAIKGMNQDEASILSQITK